MAIQVGPPPPRPPAGVVRVAFTGSFGPANWANIMHVFVSSVAGRTQSHLDTLTGFLHTSFGNRLFNPCANSSTLLETSTVMFLGGDNVLTSVRTEPITGQDGGVPLSANVALVISWKTGQFYRGGHPRTYMCGLQQDRLLNQRDWSAATIADFDAAAAFFFNEVNGLDLAQVGDVSLGYLKQFPPRGSVKNPKEYLDPPQFFPFTGHAVHPRIDTMRRRLGREFNA